MMENLLAETSAGFYENIGKLAFILIPLGFVAMLRSRNIHIRMLGCLIIISYLIVLGRIGWTVLMLFLSTPLQPRGF